MILEAFANGNLTEKAEVFLDEVAARVLRRRLPRAPKDGLELHTEILRLDRPMIDDAKFENGD